MDISGFFVAAAVILLIYLFMIFPNPLRRRRFDVFSKKYIAHRGLFDNKSTAPENTIPAFRKAVEKSYGVELDVQLTKDKKVVVIHDYDLKRVCGVSVKISELTFDELSRFKIFNSEEHVPLFSDVLKIINGSVPLVVEIKSEFVGGELCEKTAELLDDYNGNFCIESFSPFSLLWFRIHRPKFLRGQLATNFVKDRIEKSLPVKIVLTNCLANFISFPDFISYNHKYANQFSFWVCRKILRARTACWTVNDELSLEKAEEIFDAVIFDGFEPSEYK
ncbi:MAG: glycerophosphodiester phosphodiesterase family protein [Methanocorpusculum sp.]|nr:glycerophosphodiester phosphodiesterase family protein [Methanocorpusculum sp.]